MIAKVEESFFSISSAQHPYLRLFVCYLVIFCNFLVFAEDPLSHSKTGKSLRLRKTC
jgi:hypothetical protein